MDNKNVVCIYTMESYLTMKKDKIMKCIGKLMKQENRFSRILSGRW